MDLVDIASCPLPAGACLRPLAVGGLALRVATWSPVGDCRGTVAILPGRGEFIEKYAETIGELLTRRLAVAVIDWRGQGGSSRLLADRRRGHIGSFDEYQADLDALARDVLEPFCPRPYFALAHSMGGAIVLDHGARGGQLFDKIVLSAPMLDVYGLRSPRGARIAVATLARLGSGRAYIPGGTGASWMLQPFEGNVLTSDRDRYAVFNALARAAPDLLIGAPTIGWVHAAFRVMDRLAADAVLRRIMTPVLAVAAGADRVVKTAATTDVVGRLPRGEAIVLDAALHELLMERDPVRRQFWAAFDRFILESATETA